MKVFPVKDSRIVRIQVEDRDRTWAATIANAVAEAYITDNLSVRSSMTQSASDWLETQLADLETKLSKSADDLFKFKQANDIVATSWEDRQGMVSQRLVAVNDALTKVRVQKAWLESRNEQIVALADALAKGDPAAEAFALLNQSRTVQELKIRYFDARVECADMRARYLEDSPEARGLRGEGSRRRATGSRARCARSSTARGASTRRPSRPSGSSRSSSRKRRPTRSG